ASGVRRRSAPQAGSGSTVWSSDHRGVGSAGAPDDHGIGRRRHRRMAEFWTEKRVVISPDAAELVTSVAARFFDRIGKRGAGGKVTHIALTGGVIGTEVLRAIGAAPARHDIDWSLVHLWWGDEVFEPRGSAERNDEAARVLLDAIDIPAGNVHAMPGPDEIADPDA